MSLIGFGEINKNILYPIIGGLSKLIAEFILFKKEPLFNDYPFILGLIAGFGMACEIAAKEHASNYIKYQKNKSFILDSLNTSNIDYNINGALEFAMPNTLNVSINGVNSEALMLATRQFCAFSNGSACNSSSYKPSYVLSAMGLSFDRIESAIRISWGKDSINQDIFDLMIEALKKIS